MSTVCEAAVREMTPAAEHINMDVPQRRQEAAA